MKKIILATVMCCGLFLSAQIPEESTSGVVITIPNEDYLAVGLTFTARPMWELTDDLYLGGNLLASLYVNNDEEYGEFGVVDAPAFLGVGPSLRYYILQYLYGGADVAYNFEISGATGGGISIFPHVGYSFESFNLEAGYQIFEVDRVNLSGFALGIYYKL